MNFLKSQRETEGQIFICVSMNKSLTGLEEHGSN